MFRNSILLLVLLPTLATAQKMKIVSGNLSELKGQSSYNIKFMYDEMLIGTGIPEIEYVAKKKDEWEVKEKGKGEYFVQAWLNSRIKLYEPAFIKGFEKYSQFKFNDSIAQYTVLIKTLYTEPGWTVGVLNNPGEIAGEMWIIEPGNNDRLVARINFSSMEGKYTAGGDKVMPKRIESAYFICGKFLGDFLRRKSK